MNINDITKLKNINIKLFTVDGEKIKKKLTAKTTKMSFKMTFTKYQHGVTSENLNLIEIGAK